MAEFTANVGDATGFAPPNALFDLSKSIQGAQAIQQNQLGQQGAQMQLNMAGADQVGRAAAGLLSSYNDEPSRAEAYPKIVGVLQSQGLAKNAPAQYPGEAALKALVSQTIPVEEQYKLGIITPPGLTDALARANAPLPGQGGGAASGGFTGQLGQSEGGANPAAINKQGYTGQFQFGKARLQDLGYYTPAPGEDMKDNTNWAGKVTVPGFNVTDQQSFAANPAAQNAVFQSHLANIDQAITQTPGAAKFDPNGLRAVAHLGGIGGMQKFVQSGGAYSPADANGTSLAAYYNKFAGGSGAQPSLVRPTVAAATPASAGAPAAPAPYQEASLTPTPPPTGVGAPALPAPSAQPLIQAPLGPQETPAATAPAPQVAAVQPPAAPAPPPTGTAQPSTTPPPTGVNSPQFQAALELNRRATALETQFPNSPQAKAQATSLRAQAALYMQADSVSYDPVTGIGTKALTGERLNAAAPNAHYVWNQDQGAFVDTTGTHPPVTPPSPRITMTPGGVAIQSQPGGGAKVVYQSPSTVPPTGSYDQQAKAYAGDLPIIQQVGEAGRAAQASTLQLNELADVIKNVPTGGLAPEFRAKVAALLEANGAKPETIKAYTGMESGSDAQVLQKLAVATIGASAKSDLGSNVGVNSLNLYAGANPGLDKLPDANKRVTNMIRVARAQVEGYSLGAQQFFNQNQSKILHAAPGEVPDYHPVSEYNEQWQAQNNPQIGAAAIGILNGDGFDKWAARAGPTDAMNAVRLAARIDPNVKIPVKGGGFKSAQDVLNHPGSQ